MKSRLFLLLVTTAVVASPFGWSAPPAARDTAADQVSALASAAMQNVLDNLEKSNEKLRKRGITPTCTPSTLVLRKAYGSLSKAERLDYINAVKCLQRLPAHTPSDVASGAKSRFDDFIVTHIQQTLSIHYTGNFLPWHRWFVYTYEQALRNECGYTGYQPYWDWPLYQSAPQNSPIFNGDPYSMGGNGQYIPGHSGPLITAPGAPTLQLPAGLGGGCVTTGPFANTTVNLGPVGGEVGVAPGPDGGLGYNPRCLRRDVGPILNQQWANYTTVLQLLTSHSVDSFRVILEGNTSIGGLGPHGAIHYTIGGDPGGDLFTSPGDPAFYLHHGNVDRMYAYWQALDPFDRYTDLGSGLYSHITWQNGPPSRLTQLTDTIDMGYAGAGTIIGQVMSTTSGPFCYFYI